MAIILACVAVTWNRPGPWGAVPIVALVGGAGAGAIPFLFSNTIFGSPWPEGWPRDLALEVCGVALVAVALAVMRQPTLRPPGGRRVGQEMGRLPCVGAGGLFLLALLHLAAGVSLSRAGRLDDSLRLVGAAALLAVLVSALAVAGARERRSSALR